MFKNTSVEIYANANSYIRTIDADVQPYNKTITFEDGFEIDITLRMFCDLEEYITKDSYVTIKDGEYKVMEIKQWDDYLEVYLYQCQRQV